MKTRHFILTLLLAAVSLWSVSGLARAQNSAGDLLAFINDARLARGLYPYVASAELTAAAQRHSDDMAATGQISHTGSDGSSSTQRILDTGYGVYEFGLSASENIYGGQGGADVPFDSWMADPGARSNVLHEKYREVGIGVTGDDQGRTFWTLTVAAQPNVLPLFINDGATSVETLTVTLRLVPENVAPEGQGTAIGQPVEYRASTSSRFTGAEWKPWAEQVSFVLDETPGQQTVYVQLRDTADRTTVSQASVTVTGIDADATATATPTGMLATATPITPTTTATATVTATATGTPTPTRTPRTSPTPTTTPTASATPTGTPAPSPLPTASATPAPTDTPPPTNTPSPTATPTVPPPVTRPPGPTVAPPTPVQFIPGEIEEEIEIETKPPPLAERLAPWALGLQVVALILGVYVALRRPDEDR